MARAAFIERTGGPDVIEWANRDLPPPREGEVRVRHTAIGLNFIDTYYSSGLYQVPLPSGLGSEASQRSHPATGWSPNGPALGAYATERNVTASSLYKIPDAISDEIAAATFLKGCTAEFLIERCGRAQPGWTVLVHAAAGGVGQLVVQWLKHIGATVIGTVGSAEKADQARASGADHVILYKQEDIAARVREITDGKGVPLVIDGVGKDSWQASLASTAPRGLIISFSNASGPVEDVNLATLNQHGSLFVTRPKLYDYYATPEERLAGSTRLFDLLAKGALRPGIGQRFALEDADEAHRAIETGRTVGATLLLP